MSDTKRKPLAERVKWIDQLDCGIFDCWLNNLRVELFKDGGAWWSVRCIPVQDIVRFRVAGGPDAAKAEALRIVQKAVLAVAEEWRD